ncbi:bifunctional glycosyltransferase 87/phosphatase PAP2 family protein [Embleya hyalina]|uniref:Membrane protein n=1 Tax=Embleya hyalina TaxID=516124 RepID=A0A401YUB7_9ACTN|nr:bifunctional glycosyltransferase 87/phosphatase PAP2 family protein [Embleya hyalina]GCD98214.1 membrane protein [Embleya hyalina]
MVRAGVRRLLDIRRTRLSLALVGLWLLAACVAVRQANEVLDRPEDRRLPDLDAWLGPDGVLHLPGSLYDADARGTTFGGTPFAGWVLRPLTRAAENTLGVAWTVATLLIVAAIAVVVAQAVPGLRTRRARLLATPLIITLLVVSLPVRGNLSLGQLSLLPVLLALPAMLRAAPGRVASIAMGVAAALHPAMLLFAVYLWLTGKQRAAANATATFLGCTAVAWVTMPHDSFTYWVHHVAGAGLGGDADALSNQSLHGLLLRVGLSGPLEIALVVLLSAAVLWFGVPRAVAYAKDGQALLGAALAGCVMVAVSPVSWQHQQLWILLVAVARLGARQTDRMVWPVAVFMIMTFDSKTLVWGKLAAVRTIADNGPLLLAIASACAVPFITKASAEWSPRAVPQGVAEKGRFAWIPALPFGWRPLSRPNLLLELLMIRVGYQVYSFIRASVPDQRQVAEEHGQQIIDLEKFLHVDVERGLNHFVAGIGWLQSSMNFFYETFHFIVPLTILAILYVRKPAAYRSARTVLSVATLTGLVGFWLYPLAPPRLMPGYDYIDTVHGVQDLNNPDFGALTKISNQYAAMPSLHVGWSLWCGLMILAIAPKGWRWLGLLYPLSTTIVVMGTANHWIMDAVGGAAVVTLGFVVQYLLTGRSAFSVDPVAAPVAEPVAVAAGIGPGVGVADAISTPVTVGAGESDVITRSSESKPDDSDSRDDPDIQPVSRK